MTVQPLCIEGAAAPFCMPLRIAMVCARYRPFMGGTETHVHEVGRRLADAGHQVSVLTTDPTGRLPAHEHSAGMHIARVKAWPARGDLYFAPALAKHIAQGRWDIIHVQGYHTLVAPLAMCAALRSGTATVLTFHSGGHSSRLRHRARALQSAALRPLAIRAARLIAVSDFEADRFARELYLDRGRFDVIPNGANIGEAPDASADAEASCLVVSVGRLERYKGHHRAIAAMPELLKRIPNARLRVLGEGPCERDLRALVATLGLADRVTIAGIAPDNRSAMAALLSKACLVVLLSEYEAHPVAAMEALSLGKRLLVTATSGLKELADRGLARAVDLEASPRAVAAAMAEGITATRPGPVISLPTWEQCTDRLVQLYAAVLARRDQSAGYAP